MASSFPDRPNPGKPDGEVAPVRNRLQRERVTLIYQGSAPTALAGLVIALLLGWVFWPLVSHWLVTAWIGAVMATQLARLGLILAYRRALRSKVALNPAVWARRQTIVHAVLGLAWGAGAIVVIPQVSITHQAILVLFFGGAVSAGVLVAMHPPAYFAYIATTLVPCAVAMGLYASGDAKVIAPMLGLYLVVAVFIGRQVAQLADRILQLRLDNEQLVGELRQLAATDPLTGIANRREFIRRADEMLKRARETGAPATLLIYDLDRFKNVNDIHGHAVGDEVLRSTTAAALRILRSNDLIGRIGGEEFAALLARTSEEEAATIVERLRREIGAASVPCDDSKSINVTASFGVAEAADNDFDLLQMLKAADARLYEAKREGGNAVVAGPEPAR